MNDESSNYKKKLRINSISAIVLQLVTAISGMILPSLMIRTYGSAVNGVVISITQFLGYIALLESGIGGVIRAALYKPIIQGDNEKISSILCACKKFFNKISYTFLVYLLLVAVAYPILGKKGNFSFSFIFWLTLVSGISTFAQYYFCLTYQFLLQADQRIYIVNILQTLTLIINIVVSIILIKMGIDILPLKLILMIAFMIRPIAINLYVKKKYNLNKNAICDNESIKQRWDGFGHHIAFFIHRNTDVVVLTLFSNFNEISVYTVYQAVVVAIQGLIAAFSSSVSAALGSMYAEKSKLLEITYTRYETFIFVLSTFAFSVAGVMLIPFVNIYASGVDDVSYIRKAFGLLVIAAEYFYTIRIPYSNMALAAGFFKKTRNGAYIEAALNIILSLLLVQKFGIIGVAVGTVIAMIYRTWGFVYFMHNNILYRRYRHFFGNLLMSVASFVIIYFVGDRLIINHFVMKNYLQWAICASVVSVMAILVILIINMIFNKKNLRQSIKLFIK